MKIIYLISIILTFFSKSVYSHLNAFDTLGVKPDTYPMDVLRAYKRLALRYHPDALEHPLFKSLDLTPAQKREQFQKLVLAYSQIQYNNANIPTQKVTEENYREYYNQFFQDHKACGYNGINELQCETQIKKLHKYPESPFVGTNTTEVHMTNIGEFFQRDTFYYVVFYSDPAKYNKEESMMKTWRKLGNKNREWFKVWGCDCNLEPEICEVIFEQKTDVDYDAYAYPITGEKQSLVGKVTSVENYSNLAMEFINNIEIQELYEPNFHIVSAKTAKADKKLAILFTEKHNTPKVWQLLQNKFEDTLVLTTVGSSNKKMVEKFGVTEYPTMMVLDDPQNISTAKTFEGNELDKEKMIKFLNKHCKQADVKFEEFTQEMVEEGKICGKEDKFCVIFNLQGDYSLLHSVRTVPDQYKKKNIRFLYVNQGFSTELENEPGFVFIKSKRQRYAYIKKSQQKLDLFIDDALESALTFQKMPEETFKNFKIVSTQQEIKKEEEIKQEEPKKEDL